MPLPPALATPNAKLTSRHVQCDVIQPHPGCCYGYSGPEVDAAVAAVDNRGRMTLAAEEEAEEFYFRS